MDLGDFLALCTALHGAALMFWLAALALQRTPGLGPFALGPLACRRAAILALATALAWPLLQAAVVFDDAAAMIQPGRLAVLLGQTRSGHIWLAHLLLIAIAGVLGRAQGGARAGAGALCVAAALASIALLGHAAGVEGSLGGLEQGVLALHVLAAGAWVGALPILWRGAQRLAPAPLAAGLRRFSVLGLRLVALVLATGALSAWWRLGSFAALLQSNYGRWLLLKIALVALMGVAALRNRNRFTPALEASVGAASADPALRRGLRASLALESVLGAVVLCVAVLLAAAEAPH